MRSRCVVFFYLCFTLARCTREMIQRFTPQMERSIRGTPPFISLLRTVAKCVSFAEKSRNQSHAYQAFQDYPKNVQA
ncbi:hypothetical protein F5Y10DRAFT_20886 [Nemania abortiva]|nr:hypothetical protein F5Y10DRAFT_20886 [Nemania abortiva]